MNIFFEASVCHFLASFTAALFPLNASPAIQLDSHGPLDSYGPRRLYLPLSFPSRRPSQILIIFLGEEHSFKAMERPEKTVFICFRRHNIPWALAIFQNLTARGFDVFFDYMLKQNQPFRPPGSSL
jgi:hypothetical protein